ncbi:hypothetical protein Pan153_52390 [Gimesia panareensis]|uniref:Nickel uptake substrate-specific transmembrane region n=1 Tax=Gimesia panareensis TaxID=2527978 RepID=A0A518FW31_9PLAN|nr:hypothetical protein [Gimesia panareensis]QDV20563.1 hypothetical protein Pan153_52390 [Gimesia panareensis]
MSLARVLLFGLAVLSVSTASANITVNGTIRYWNGDLLNADGSTGGYVPAKHLQVQVENNNPLLGDLNTWTDQDGKYSVTFKQKRLVPDFTSLDVNVEVRASVKVDRVKRDWTMDTSNLISVHKRAFIPFPYNGQTHAVRVQDKTTATINVYVHGPDQSYTESALNGRYNLPITSWDHDDDGRRTLAGIFMCQACEEEYVFLRDRAATKKELSRNTSSTVLDPFSLQVLWWESVMLFPMV